MIVSVLEWDGVIDSVSFDQFGPLHEWHALTMKCGAHRFKYIHIYAGF